MAPLTGYPDSFGGHRFSVFPHSGVASYVRVTVGPLANGDTVRVAEAGMKFFDFVFGGITDSGQFRVEPVPAVGNPSRSKNGAAGATYKLRWVALVTATVGGQSQTVNTEAAASTDLSGQVVRLAAVGRY